MPRKVGAVKLHPSTPSDQKQVPRSCELPSNCCEPVLLLSAPRGCTNGCMCVWLCLLGYPLEVGLKGKQKENHHVWMFRRMPTLCPQNPVLFNPANLFLGLQNREAESQTTNRGCGNTSVPGQTLQMSAKKVRFRHKTWGPLPLFDWIEHQTSPRKWVLRICRDSKSDERRPLVLKGGPRNSSLNP